MWKMTFEKIQAIILLFIEGFLICGFLSIFEYSPEANASANANSFLGHLNGRAAINLPSNHTCRIIIFIYIVDDKYQILRF